MQDENPQELSLPHPDLPDPPLMFPSQNKAVLCVLVKGDLPATKASFFEA